MEKAPLLKKSPDVAVREFDGETILIPLCATSKEADFIYVLDDIGTAIWRLVNGKRNQRQIEELLAQEYDVSLERLRRSVSVFIQDLEKVRALL